LEFVAVLDLLGETTATHPRAERNRSSAWERVSRTPYIYFSTFSAESEWRERGRFSEARDVSIPTLELLPQSIKRLIDEGHRIAVRFEVHAFESIASDNRRDE
jgi:hypothetical protein